MRQWKPICEANIPISDPLIQHKADYLALRLGIPNFKFSNGWLQRFKERNNLIAKVVCQMVNKIGTTHSVERKIFLLLDRCAAHSAVGLELLQVTLLCVPANTTSFLQPLDQGIIQCVKNYKTRQLELKEETNLRWNILNAMQYVWMAWNKVTTPTIANCFRKAGIGAGEEDTDGIIFRNICSFWSSFVQVDDEAPVVEELMCVDIQSSAGTFEETKEDNTQDNYCALLPTKDATLENVLLNIDVDKETLLEVDEQCKLKLTRF
ncbi:hypothetical protein PR048_031862 [Dryococelus australis]|uniref:HTH CENPB-type domain-containing protein n=1 Tax=Dryococelus australis TaxID=614101 RepID=A0ABQ9G729_9NEOP|nr:hypothetical protein PR048_031862 [Dryococelus australis]